MWWIRIRLRRCRHPIWDNRVYFSIVWQRIRIWVDALNLNDRIHLTAESMIQNTKTNNIQSHILFFVDNYAIIFRFYGTKLCQEDSMLN